MLVFDIPQHIPRWKQIFETLEKSIFTQTILDHFQVLLNVCLFIHFSKILWYWKFSVFVVLLFVKEPKNNLDENTEEGIHIYSEGQFLNHYDYWPILGQFTRNLIIEGVMFNYNTPWKNIYFFISSKNLSSDNQELDIFKK